MHGEVSATLHIVINYVGGKTGGAKCLAVTSLLNNVCSTRVCDEDQPHSVSVTASKGHIMQIFPALFCVISGGLPEEGYVL